MVRLADVAGEFEDGNASTEREGGAGGEALPKVVDPAQRLDSGGALYVLPLAVAEVVHVEVAAPLGREEQRSRRDSRPVAPSVCVSPSGRVLATTTTSALDACG